MALQQRLFHESNDDQHCGKATRYEGDKFSNNGQYGRWKLLQVI